MKQKLFSMPYFLVIAAIMLLVSCKKGDTGPAGPQGPAGTAGTPGSAGPAGPAGPAGTANVVYSEWLTVAFNAQTDPARYSANITAPKLVDSILTKGEIKVYLNYGTAASADVVPLPIFDPIYYTPALTLYPDFVVGKIVLTSNRNMGTFNNASGEKVYQYRYILIPGGTTAGRAATGGKTIDWNNYKEVQAYLGLKD